MSSKVAKISRSDFFLTREIIAKGIPFSVMVRGSPVF